MVAPFIIGGLASVASSLINANSANKAAKAQQRALAQANQVAETQYNRGLEMYAPFRQSGTRAMGTFEDSLGLNGAEGGARAAGLYQNSADYQGALTGGQRAIDASAAARGGLFSGATGKRLMDHGVNTNAQYLQQYRGNLGQLMGQGFNATNNAAQLGQNYANTVGGNVTAAGNARAQGILGQGQAFSDGVSNVAGLANYYRPWQPSGGASAPATRRAPGTTYGGTPSFGGYFG